MPLKPSSRKPKRAVARGVVKDHNKNKIDCALLLQRHEAVRLTLAAAPAPDAAGVCLARSPQGLVRDMQRTFALEFPQHAHRVQFLYNACI